MKRIFLLFTALTSVLIISTAHSSDALDMNAFGRIASNEKIKDLKFPDIDSMKQCSKISAGLVGVWGDKSLFYRATIKQGSGILVGDSFVADSKIDELQSKYKNDCVFKTEIDGSDAYFNILGEGESRKISITAVAPAKICRNVSLHKLTNDQKKKTLLELRVDLKKTAAAILESLRSESDERLGNMVNKNITQSRFNNHMEAMKGCGKAFRSISDTNAQDFTFVYESEAQSILFNQNNEKTFPGGLTVGGKFISNLNLSYPYSKELMACVDDLPINSNINTLGENNIVFNGFDEKQKAQYFFKGKDNNYFSVPVADILDKGSRSCKNETVQWPGTGTVTTEVCRTTLDAKLPNGETVAFVLSVSNNKQPDGSYRQNSRMTVVDKVFHLENQPIINAKVADEKVAVGAMVGSIQQAMTNYPTEIVNNKTANINEDTKKLFKDNFSKCRDLLNNIAPSEKSWNEFAYHTSQGMTPNREVANENDGASGISK